MKKFSVLVAFICAVMISSTALAADWVKIDTGDDSTVYVDKSSIIRGIQSKHYDFSRTDGCSAIVKIEFAMPDRTVTLINLVGFFEENGAKKYILLESFDENGKLSAQQLDKVEPEAADGTSGTIWPKVYDYVQKNVQ